MMHFTRADARPEGKNRLMSGKISPLRLKEMICLAEFEQGGGKRAIRICQYGRSGYIALRMIISFFFAVAAAALLVFLAASGDLDGFLLMIQNADPKRLLSAAAVFFVLAAAAYLTVTYMKADAEYRKAEKQVRIYEERIQMLLRFPDAEDPSRR